MFKNKCKCGKGKSLSKPICSSMPAEKLGCVLKNDFTWLKVLFVMVT